MRRRRRRFRNRRAEAWQGFPFRKKTLLAVVQLFALIQRVNNSTVRLLGARGMLQRSKCLRVGHGYVISRYKQDLGHIVIRPGLRFEAFPAVDLPGVSGRFLSGGRSALAAQDTSFVYQVADARGCARAGRRRIGRIHHGSGSGRRLPSGWSGSIGLNPCPRRPIGGRRFGELLRRGDAQRFYAYGPRRPCRGQAS